jgi:plastocyanin
MRKGITFGLALGLVAEAHAAGVTVRGTVTVKGVKNPADAVVSLEAPGLPVVPSKEPVKIDQKGFRFVPHVSVVVPGTAIRFLNNDPEPHNVYSPEGRYNLGTWPTGETRDHVFTQPGIYSQLCNVHPDMLAFVVVVPTPYFAKTDATGRFEIRGVPPGKYTAVVFHEKKDGLEQAVVVGAGPEQTLDLFVER